MSHTSTVLTRDCDAIQVPYGNAVTARAGTMVTITQTLGNTYTVQTNQGYLLRIEGKDADALGVEIASDANTEHTQHIPFEPIDDAILWDKLKTCYDPEIPANIVDLGLIYACTKKLLDDGTYHVDVEMTLTAPGCGMGQVLKDDVQRKLFEVPGISVVRVELVFMPPWDQSMMSEAARLQLGML